MSVIDRVRIMVLGDSGVGKTSFVHLAAHNEPIKAPGWTVGCSVEVKLHEYKEGTPSQTKYFIEFWDVGGSKNHRNTRHVFYNPCHGLILVHDLTNRKSEENLRKYFQEITNQKILTEDFDAETFLGSSQIPILVIGTKVDLVDERKGRGAKAADVFSADEIVLDCRETKYLGAGTTNAVKLSRFYDRVIEKGFGPRGYTERFNATSPNLPSKFYSTFPHQD